jgi:hypothetical protein
MSFNEVLAELPGMTVAERQLLVRRALELDDSTLSPEHIAMVEERLEAHRHNPGSALTLEQMEARLRKRHLQ